MRTLSFILLLCLFVSCKSNKKDSDEITIGKYLYLTDNGVLHCEKKCVGIILAKDEYEHRVTGMTFVDTLEFVYDNNLSYCTRCFNDTRYEQVQGMIKRNRKNKTMPGVLQLDSIAYEY